MQANQLASIIRMCDSLRDALDVAHGGYNITVIAHMTVADFIMMYASNGIRFVCDENQIIIDNTMLGVQKERGHEYQDQVCDIPRW